MMYLLWILDRQRAQISMTECVTTVPEAIFDCPHRIDLDYLPRVLAHSLPLRMHRLHAFLNPKKTYSDVVWNRIFFLCRSWETSSNWNDHGQSIEGWKYECT